MSAREGGRQESGQNGQKAARSQVPVLPVVVAIAAGFAVAGSRGGSAVGAVPVFALCVCLAFVIQWAAFVPAFLLQTERFYDLTGSATFITVTITAVTLASTVDLRSVLLMVMVLLWAVRLGGYLFRRVLRAGKDTRFDAIKPSFSRFLVAWSLQGLWVTLTLGAALAAITSDAHRSLDPLAYAGLVVWVVGFGLEVVADVQKSRFRADPANRGAFIRTGLWAWSRHPNYLGEIVLWIGVALVAVPVLRGWQWATIISPVFVYLLIARVSGVPLLEKSADARWGGRDDYEAYKARTAVLIPLPRRVGGASLRG